VSPLYFQANPSHRKCLQLSLLLLLLLLLLRLCLRLQSL
jgi:hypothetical protein